jgi:type I restriction enzyme M protein
MQPPMQPPMQPSPLSPHALQGQLFASLNERMRRAGVETAERAPLMTLFMATLHVPGASQVWMQERQGAVALSRAMLALLTQTRVPDVLAFADFMHPRLIQGDTITTGARALHAVVHDDIPRLCAEWGWTVAACHAALQGEAFKLVDLYEAFQTHVGGNDMGQYFTPRHIVRAMARMVEILRGRPFDANDVVYDPAAGVGGFLIAAIERAQHHDPKASPPQLIGAETTTSVTHMARLNLWMASHQETCGHVFNQSSLERDHLPHRGEVGEVTLDHPMPGAHPMLTLAAQGLRPTVVLMNPPFPEDKKAYQSFEFVEHALRTLDEGGVLAALIPAVLVIGEDRHHTLFRERVLRHAQLQAVITMPPALFAPGASVNTYVVVLRKQTVGHTLSEPVFFARAQEDGFDMDRSLRKRSGPRTELESESRGWCAPLGMGGTMAQLFVHSTKAQEGTGWLFVHAAAKASVHHANRQASSVCLLAIDGSDWAPERFIEDRPPPEKIIALANHIASQAACEQVRQRFLARVTGPLELDPIGPEVLVRVRKRLGQKATVNQCLAVARASVSGAKGWGAQGAVAVISASEQDNGVCGYTATNPNVAPFPGLSVAKNGRPGVSRVQTQPYAVTGDVAALTPRQAQWSVAELCVLAALIEIQSWRFSYGRKASERRLGVLSLSL